MPEYYDGNNMILTSTSREAKGLVRCGTSAYDEAQNRLGIGTDAPSTTLDVVGTVQATGLKMPTGAALGHVLTSDEDGAASWSPLGSVQGHGDLTGLANDDHLQYAAVEGRPGGQILTGGTDVGDSLELRSTTSQEGLGRVVLGSHGVVVDESMASAVGIGCNPVPGDLVQLVGDGPLGISMQRASVDAIPGGDLTITAGAPKSGEANQPAGNLVLSSGMSTGTGSAVVQVLATPPGPPGAADNHPNVVAEFRGFGDVILGRQGSLPQNATDGFLVIPTLSTGDPTGTPASVPAGMCAIGFCPATGKLAVWDGSAWCLYSKDAG